MFSSGSVVCCIIVQDEFNNMYVKIAAGYKSVIFVAQAYSTLVNV